MSSGYFKLSHGDDWAKELHSARKLIRGVIAKWNDSICYLNGEDVGYDTTFIDGLGLAALKIDECISLDESDMVVVDEQIKQARNLEEQAQCALEKWLAIRSKAKAAAFADQVVGGIRNFVEGDSGVNK